MYRKNVAGQFLYFGLINATTGAALTGATITAYRAIDNAAQAAATGSIVEDGNGQYHLSMSQADTNGNNIGFLFTATNAIPISICIVTTAADPTDSVRFGLTALPNAAAGANNGLPLGDANGDVTVGSYFTGQAPLQPTVAGRTLDVTATGEAGIDWANIGAPTTTVALTGTSIASSPATLSVGERNAIADAILKRDWTAVTGEAARSVLNALRLLRNKWAFAATTLTVYKEDGAAVAWASNDTVSASANPVTGQDPTT